MSNTAFHKLAFKALRAAAFVSLCGMPAWAETRSADATDQTKLNKEQGSMESVTGIGGFFFKSVNPESLANWYRDNLGVNKTPTDYDTAPWMQEAGPTVFGPFNQNTDYFGSDEQQWMLNFRVSDLDKMVLQLRSNGIEVDVDPTTYPNGRFARLQDPEGNPIQLWEPGN